MQSSSLSSFFVSALFHSPYVCEPHPCRCMELQCSFSWLYSTPLHLSLLQLTSIWVVSTWGMMNSAAMKFLCMFCVHIFCFSVGSYRNGIGVPRMLVCSALVLTAFQNSRTNLYFHQQHKRTGWFKVNPQLGAFWSLKSGGLRSSSHMKPVATKSEGGLSPPLSSGWHRWVCSQMSLHLWILWFVASLGIPPSRGPPLYVRVSGLTPHLPLAPGWFTGLGEVFRAASGVQLFAP